MVGKILDEFKSFALKGNMIDLAVGVVIGGAFGKVITSIVSNVIMPLISYVTPNTDFSDWKLGKIMIGNFLNDVIAFLIVAIAIFIFVVKFMGFLMRLKKKEEAAPAAPPPLTKDQLLLEEIRDLLKANSGRVG